MTESTLFPENVSDAAGLFNLAHSYFSSAVALHEAKVEAVFPDEVVNFLIYHSHELYMKALLRVQGVNRDQLQNHYRHSIPKIVEAAKEQGFVLNEVELKLMTLLTNTDAGISSRYIRYGNHKRLSFQDCYIACHSLHERIGAEIDAIAGQPLHFLPVPAPRTSAA